MTPLPKQQYIYTPQAEVVHNITLEHSLDLQEDHTHMDKQTDSSLNIHTTHSHPITTAQPKQSQKRQRQHTRLQHMNTFEKNITTTDYDHSKSITQNFQNIMTKVDEYTQYLNKMHTDCIQSLGKTIPQLQDISPPTTTTTTTIEAISNTPETCTLTSQPITILTHEPTPDHYTTTLHNTTTIQEIKGILQTYANDQEGRTDTKQQVITTQEESKLRMSAIEQIFTTKPVVITDDDTVLARAQEDIQDITPRIFKTNKTIFEEIRQVQRQHTTIIQIIDSHI